MLKLVSSVEWFALVSSSLSILCSAATLRPPLSLQPTNATDTPALNLNQNLSSPSLTAPSFLDPRFSVDMSTADVAISAKSLYMTSLQSLLDLARYDYGYRFRGGHWSSPTYGDVSFSITVPAFSPQRRQSLEYRHAMWAVYHVMVYLGRKSNGPTLARGKIFWQEPGRAREMIGEIQVNGAGLPGLFRGSENQTDTDATSLIRRVDPTAEDFRPGNSTLQNQTPSPSLSARRRRNLRPNFVGPPLNPLSVFICIGGALIGAAAAPRHPFSFEHALFGDERSGMVMEIEVWPEARRAPPYLQFDDFVWLLGRIPRYMYGEGRFRVGQFVLLVEGVPLVEGGFAKVG